MLTSTDFTKWTLNMNLCGPLDEPEKEVDGAEHVGQRAEPAMELDGAIECDAERVLPQTGEAAEIDGGGGTRWRIGKEK